LYTDHDGTNHIELTWYNGSEENVVIPSEFDGAVVDTVQANFGDLKNIKSITVSEGIKTIDKLWFWSSKNVDIYLPSSVVSIGSEAIRNNKINTIHFSEGLVSIDHYAFLDTEFKNTDIKLPESLEYLNPASFNGTNIQKIHLGSKVRFADYDYNFGDPIIDEHDKEDSDFEVFYECLSLAFITVSPDNEYLTAVDDVLYNKDMTVLYRFPSKHNSDFEKNNPVYDYEIPESVKYLAPYSFGDANIYINKLTFNSKIETIPKRAFRKANINEIDWGDNCNI
uniref:leucine-rich repeat protein n=1 Tax=Eubacterium sp. TaxID=142586 RepID=UPI004025820B